LVDITLMRIPSEQDAPFLSGESATNPRTANRIKWTENRSEPIPECASLFPFEHLANFESPAVEGRDPTLMRSAHFFCWAEQMAKSEMVK
jgi:hypothetical protein